MAFGMHGYSISADLFTAEVINRLLKIVYN